MELTKQKRSIIILSIAAAFLIAMACLVPHAVSADDTVRYQGQDYPLNTSGDWQYIVTNEGVIIMGNTTTAPTITIPDNISGKPVVAIGQKDAYNAPGAFEGNSSMQVLSIPASVRRIDPDSFRKCTGLQQVLISDGVTEIGEYAFADCNYLQQIQFKGNVLKTIGKCAFENCIALDKLTLPASVETIGERAFVRNTALSSIVIPDSVTSLGGGAFAGCSVLKEVVIGNGVTELPADGYGNNAGYDSWSDGTFENCPALNKVTIGTGVVTIGTDAFAGDGLLEITIPENVVTIGNGAFYECKSMKNATIGNGVKTMGNCVFYQCPSLETIDLGNNVRSIGERAFTGNTRLKEITIPSSVITLGGGSFAGCSSMTKAVIGNGVTELGSAGYNYNSGSDSWSDGMFESCSLLAEVKIGDGVITIGTDAFAGTALRTVIIPDNVVTLGNGVFMNCDALETARIGNGVTSIGERAFEEDDALISVSIGKGVVDIGNRAFRQCRSLRTLLIPSGVTSLGGGLCAGCTSLTRVIIGTGVLSLSASGYGNNMGTDSWSDGTFEGCTSLSDISLGSGITSIGVDTFAGTIIRALLIPTKVSKIESGAFYTDTLANLYFTCDAPTMENKLFQTQTPLMYRLQNNNHYDENWGYIVSEFTPIKVKFDINQTKYPDVFAITPYDQDMTPEGGYVIEPLEPFSEGYKFMGWCKDPDGTQPWDFTNDKVTADTTIYASWKKTSEIVPDAPGKIGVEAPTGNSVYINWASVDGADSYSVYVDGKKVASDLTDCKYTVTGLEPDSVYEITITAVNAMGESSASLVKVVQTTEETYTLGDLDGDGAPTSSDALKVLYFAARLEIPDTLQTEIADVNKDGQVDSADALKILQYAAHLIDSFD